VLDRFTRRAGIAIGIVAAGALFAAPAQADGAPSITPTFDARQISDTIAADNDTVVDASFVRIPPGSYGISPAAKSDVELTSFATEGSRYGMLTTGDPRIADDDNNSQYSGTNAGSGHFQGDHNYDVTIMKVDVEVPSGANCLSIDYRFLSEEFPEYVGGGYNDTFIAQLDRYDWNAALQEVSAPGDFASTANPIGIDNSGIYDVTAERAEGTTYDAATRLITARTPVTPGQHSVYLSIFDQGDPKYDSAVFLDNLVVDSSDAGACESPEEPVTPGNDSNATGGDESQPGPAAPPVRTATAEPDSNIADLGARISSKQLKYFNGTASAGDGVQRVEIALVGARYGARAAARRKKPRCVQMNARHQMVQRKPRGRKCSKLEWIKVDGTQNWSFELNRRLPKGSYTLYSRAVDHNGKAEQSFSAADGNKLSFNVH
jgi:hypothetical protein